MSLMDYVREGPSAGETMIQRAVGIWFWWKVWMIAVFMFGGLAVAMKLAQGMSGPAGAYVGFFIGWIAVSIYYEVVSE